MRSGCLGLLSALAVRTLSAVLVAAGAALLLYGFLASSPNLDVATVLTVVLVPVAAFVLYLVGRGVWRDLKGSKTPAKDSLDTDSKEEHPTSGRGSG